jgi:hypothetical protein
MYTNSPIASAPTTIARTNTAIGQRGLVDTARGYARSVLANARAGVHCPSTVRRDHDGSVTARLKGKPRGFPFAALGLLLAGSWWRSTSGFTPRPGKPQRETPIEACQSSVRSGDIPGYWPRREDARVRSISTSRYAPSFVRRRVLVLWPLAFGLDVIRRRGPWRTGCCSRVGVLDAAI